MEEKISSLIKEIEPCVWEITKHESMQVPARIYADKKIIDSLIEAYDKEWSALRQLINVASLPGIQLYALAMADVHPGYGFPIGGVAAFDKEKGIIAAGGVGFDINCGVRSMVTDLSKQDVEKIKKELAERLYRHIPAGLGSKGELRLNKREIDEVLVKGALYVIDRGYGNKDDLKFIEENGCMKHADPHAVSDKAKERQFRQVGTLGSGNHYLEVQYVETVYDEKAASIYGLEANQIVVSFHCGSRALGHQVGTDYLKILEKASRKYGIKIMEKELVCAPFQSEEGQLYWKAVNAAINCAFANRQVLAALVRKVFASFGWSESSIRTFYEIGHNTVKLEKHKVNDSIKELIVHRKGATRAFGPGREEVPHEYRSIGQPVLVGGTMGTSSYILHGTSKAMKATFGSAIHGAGRALSRHQAKRQFKATELLSKLAERGILVKGHSFAGIAEEAPEAYKPVDEIVEVMHVTGIAKKVVRLKPLICIKG